MIYAAFIIGGFAILAFILVLDDIRVRQSNQQLTQRLALLNEELQEADAQGVRYMETIAHERQGKTCDSKGTCKCG